LSFDFLASCLFSDKHETSSFVRLFVEEIAILLEILSYLFSWKIKRSGDGKASLGFASLEMIGIFIWTHIHPGFL
jgi:hypothetical protein